MLTQSTVHDVRGWLVLGLDVVEDSWHGAWLGADDERITNLVTLLGWVPALGDQ